MHQFWQDADRLGADIVAGILDGKPKKICGRGSYMRMFGGSSVLRHGNNEFDFFLKAKESSFCRLQHQLQSVHFKLRA
jgi:hypothetical protein